MNSGMETVSISTKSALPNSKLSCSAMAPACGLRWAQTGSGGRARAAGAGGGGARGELGRGRGGAAARSCGVCGGAGRRSAGLGRTEAASLLLGALSAGAAHPAVSAFPRRLPGAVGDGTPRRRRRRLVPPLALVWPRPRPVPAGPLQLRPAPPRRLSSPPPSRSRQPPPHLGGAHARGGRRGRAPARARSAGRQRPLGTGAGISGRRYGGART